MIKTGSKARDTVSGFEGLVVARTEWLHGCARITIQPQKLTADGKPIEAHTFDELQCETVEEPKIAPKRNKGGPRPDVPQKSGPVR